ncbi:MAG: lysophospholipid acyltransferase family protein [Gammaproteobacteria bacterium]|jgi:KDO2-lipid IV(A) lauroyltransferase
MHNIKAYVKQLKPGFLGNFFFYCLPYRKKIVLANMRKVFKQDLTESEIKILAKAFYRHIAKMLWETIMLRFLSTSAIKKRGVVIGYEKVLKAAEQHKGVLILTGHFGSWEFAPIAGMLNFTQYKNHIYVVRKNITTKFIEKILFRRFYDAGLRVIPKKNSLHRVCEVLDQNNAVLFVMDQHASIKVKDGIMVDFFGEKAGTFRSLAMIAQHTGVSVIPACSYRRSDNQHVLRFYDPIPWEEGDDSKQTIAKNTLNYNKFLEKMILDHPDQWLWMHRRWKKGH